jgi:hypothetical protein
MTNTLQFTTAHPSYANNIVHDVLRYSYRTPSSVLTEHDYRVQLGVQNVFGSTVEVGSTDWTHAKLWYEMREALRKPYYWESHGMVCCKTGYTAKQMLAAMLNAELADELLYWN